VSDATYHAPSHQLTYAVVCLRGGTAPWVYVDGITLNFLRGGRGWFHPQVEMVHSCTDEKEAYAVAEMVSLERCIPLTNDRDLIL